MKSVSVTDRKHVGTQTHSSASLVGRTQDTSYDSLLQISYDNKETELLSFRQWHERMQREHNVKFETSVRPQFSLWNWCNRACAPCRYVDSVDYNRKLCVVCLKFRTLKNWLTCIIIAVFFYIILYQVLGDDVLPGGTFFLLFVMFVLAFLAGIILLNIGLPPTVGQILVGMVAANLPYEYDQRKVWKVMEYSEKLGLVIILIRAALQLEFAQIHGRFLLIFEFALVPYLAEFILVFLLGYFWMKMPWTWSALQGFILAPVSLASVVSNLEKGKKLANHEYTKNASVLVAASSIEIIITIYAYSLTVAVIFSKGVPWVSSWWALLLAIILQLIGGLIIGVVLGCLAGMFPDRRSVHAPYCRIIFIGMGTIAQVLTFHNLGMSGVGVLSSLTMVFVASNIWAELGWHESSNPVVYFYSIIYFFAQPICVSLVGFSMKFHDMELSEVGMTIAIILIGIIGREIFCLLVTLDKTLATAWSERIFICISWIPKGAIEALLGAALTGIVKENYSYVTNPDFTLKELTGFAQNILQVTTFGILITSPLACLLTTFLTPYLFK